MEKREKGDGETEREWRNNEKRGEKKNIMEEKKTRKQDSSERGNKRETRKDERYEK